MFFLLFTFISFFFFFNDTATTEIYTLSLHDALPILVVLGGVVVIVVLLWAFIERTLIGKAMVATAANQLAARLVGIDTRRIVGLSFAISAAIGAVAGILITPITLTSYDVGTLLALKGFAAAMLG